jgi:hypothetical protein
MKTFEQYEPYDPDYDYKKSIYDIIDNLEIKFDFMVNYYGLYYFHNNDVKFMILKRNKLLYIDEDLRITYNIAYNSYRHSNKEILNSLNIYNDYDITRFDENFKISSNKLFNQ